MQQFTDSFDHYNTAFLQAQSMYENVSGSPVISTAYARFPAIGSFPNYGVSIPANGFLRKNLKSNQPTLIAFLSFGVASLPASNTAGLGIFVDNGVGQIGAGVTPSGAIQFRNGDNAVLATSAPGLVAPSPTSKPNHGLEIQVTISNASGSVLAYLDGALVISLTSGDTQNSANAYANQFQVGVASGNLGFAGSTGIYCDYVRVWDITGSYQNAPVGFDVRKLAKLAVGAGDLTQWTANGAGANYLCTNEASPDGDTTYVSSTSTNYDSYAMGTSGLTGVPSQVVVKSYARKDDGATRSLQIGVRSSSANGLGTSFTLGTTYTWVDACISVDPATGFPPTAAAADAFQHLKFESA